MNGRVSIEVRNKGGFKTRYINDLDAGIVAKSCSRCYKMIAIQLFNKNKACLGGRMTMCKSCQKTRNKEFYSMNKDKVANNVIRWRTNNPERVAGYTRKWLSKNPNYSSLRNIRRKSNLNNLPTLFPKEDRDSILEYFGNSCALTGSSNWSWDHVIPLNSGIGGTFEGNMVPLRPDLNSSKGDKNIFDWFEDNKEKYGLEDSKFKLLISYLSITNDLSPEDYKDFIYVCNQSS